MQLFKIVTRRSPGEGDDYTEIKTHGKRCTVTEKVVGKSAKVYDIDANGAAYLVRQLLDERAKLSQQDLFTLRLDGGSAEPEIHPTLAGIMQDHPRSSHSPVMARWVWGQCHPLEVA